MLTSIVIPVRDEDPRMLRDTLAGIRTTTRHLPVEIVVVDDGSVYPIEPISLGDARLLRHPSPRGVSVSRRAGAMLAAGDLLVWLDAHMTFGPNWLQQIAVQAHAGALVCSPFWNYDLTECLCWGADFSWNPVREYRAGKSPGFGVRHRVQRPEGAAVEVPMVIGACYAMRRETYERLGGFCPHFKVWGVDEQDISGRAWISGMRVLCAVHAQVGHHSRTSFPYPVQFEHLEFNQSVMIRSLFQRATIDRLEPAFHPIAPDAAAWLAATDLTAWRNLVQRRRTMTDAAFLERFVPDLAPAPSRKAKSRPKRRAGKAQSS